MAKRKPATPNTTPAPPPPSSTLVERLQVAAAGATYCVCSPETFTENVSLFDLNPNSRSQSHSFMGVPVQVIQGFDHDEFHFRGADGETVVVK